MHQNIIKEKKGFFFSTKRKIKKEESERKRTASIEECASASANAH